MVSRELTFLVVVSCLVALSWVVHLCHGRSYHQTSHQPVVETPPETDSSCREERTEYLLAKRNVRYFLMRITTNLRRVQTMLDETSKRLQVRNTGIPQACERNFPRIRE